MNQKQNKKPDENIVKPSEAIKTTVQERYTLAPETKRFDHHLIDEDLGLEDKNGHRLNPKDQLQDSVRNQSSSTEIGPSE